MPAAPDDRTNWTLRDGETLLREVPAVPALQADYKRDRNRHSLRWAAFFGFITLLMIVALTAQLLEGRAPLTPGGAALSGIFLLVAGAVTLTHVMNARGKDMFTATRLYRFTDQRICMLDAGDGIIDEIAADEMQSADLDPTSITLYKRENDSVFWITHVDDLPGLHAFVTRQYEIPAP